MAIYFKVNCGLSLVLICSCLNGTDALCSQTSAGIKRFGTDCRLVCHCMDNEQCNARTGECDSGCDFEWVGPGCQYKNIALEQVRRHMDNTYPHEYAELANDRNLSTCSFTNTSDAAKLRTVAPWFTVWLPYYARFKEITFITKTEYLSQFPRFNLTVQNISQSDSKNWVYNSDGNLCYQHDNSIPNDTTVKITCTGTPVGNQIRLQLANTSTQLVVCDFRIYGECKDRTWGTPCVNHCGLCKNLSQCDATTGRCPTGCEPGYITSICNEACPNGHYGLNCEKQCRNCLSNTCRNTDGLCSGGCIPGLKDTPFCDEECEDGNYGINCQNRCSENCNDICNKTNGYCQGCKAGWFGFNCSTECSEGSWGEDCLRTCGKCMNGSCDRFSGDCSGICKPGYKFNRYCDEECETGRYGNNCTGECSLGCKDVSLCRKTDGYCATESSAATTKVIAGVGTTLIIVIILGVLVILWYQRRTRNGSDGNTRSSQAKHNVAMIDLSDKTRCVKSNEETDGAYETVKDNNEDEHQYEFY